MIQITPDNIQKISKSLLAGEVVALPTETVFGLAVSLNSAAALEKLIFLKRREINSGKIFTLVPESLAAIKNYAKLNKFTSDLIKKHFPGELTLILPKNPNFSHPYFNHFTSVGIRIPNHPLFAQLLPETGPLLLTSANQRGATPALTSDEVVKNLKKVDVVVVGSAGNNPPSTILDCTSKTPEILRKGNLAV